jgi:transposase InsO family protein
MLSVCEGGTCTYLQQIPFSDNQVFASQAQARREIFEYIEVYYNNRRLRSALGYQTPS